MRTKTINIYKFRELSEKAQEKALEKWRETEDFSFHSQNTIEDCCDIAEMFGLDIRQRKSRNGKNETIWNPSVYYSGFCSQGDGACFEGSYQYKKGALKAVKTEYPNDTELHKIVKNLQDLQKKYFYGISANTYHSGHYYHENCMHVNVDHCEHDINDEIEEGVTEILRDFACYIYKRLETEYEFVMSDEYIRESIENGDYEFYEDGAMV